MEEQPEFESPGELMRRLRTTAGISQKMLARAITSKSKINTSDASVSEWERGVTSPPFEKARAADAALSAGGELLRALHFEAPGPSNQDVIARIDALDQKLSDAVVSVRRLMRGLASQLKQQAETLERLAIRDATPAAGTPRPDGERPAPRRAEPESRASRPRR